MTVHTDYLDECPGNLLIFNQSTTKEIESTNAISYPIFFTKTTVATINVCQGHRCNLHHSKDRHHPPLDSDSDSDNSHPTNLTPHYRLAYRNYPVPLQPVHSAAPIPQASLAK
jgi:hypothetical protein